MKPIVSFVSLAVTFLAQGACASTAASPSPLTADSAVHSTVSLLPDSAIAAILRQRVEAGKTPGIVVGVLDAGGLRVVAHGSGGPSGPAALDGNTLFEIGSITKVFTATLLADMVARGEVRLDDPVAKYLPAGTLVPSKPGREITLLDLVTHTSGLPRLPNNLSPRDAANPYVDYTPEKLYAFLARHELRRSPGAEFEYSNLGAGLLGHALGLRAGVGFEHLVRARVLDPLGMTDTRITLTPAEVARLASGYNAGGQVVPPWDLASLQGAGALRSSAADMIRFLAANIASHSDSPRPYPLSEAMRAAHAIARPVSPAANIGLGWLRTRTSGGHEILWHDGGTGGHRSFAGFDPTRRVAVVVLSASSADVGDIGRILLDNREQRERVAVDVSPAALDGLVGKYALSAQFHITVTRQGSQLYVQATGQPRVPAFAESETDFFLRVVDAQITFVRGADGRATSLTLHQNGMSSPGPRVD